MSSEKTIACINAIFQQLDELKSLLEVTEGGQQIVETPVKKITINELINLCGAKIHKGVLTKDIKQVLEKVAGQPCTLNTLPESLYPQAFEKLSQL